MGTVVYSRLAMWTTCSGCLTRGIDALLGRTGRAPLHGFRRSPLGSCARPPWTARLGTWGRIEYRSKSPSWSDAAYVSFYARLVGQCRVDVAHQAGGEGNDGSRAMKQWRYQLGEGKLASARESRLDVGLRNAPTFLTNESDGGPGRVARGNECGS